LRSLSLCTCCRHYPGAATGRIPSLIHPTVSAFPEGVVGSACASSFSRCSAFTRVTACTLSPSPIRDTHSEGFSYFVTSMAAPVASGWSGRRGRDRGTARATLGQGLAVSAFPLLRARLTLSIAHVSVRPPCHPGRSHLASPVGDHDYPCAIFPDSLWLKRSLAYAPGARKVYRAARQPCVVPITPAQSPA
jgi:hypothetical protein